MHQKNESLHDLFSFKIIWFSGEKMLLSLQGLVTF